MNTAYSPTLNIADTIFKEFRKLLWFIFLFLSLVEQERKEMIRIEYFDYLPKIEFLSLDSSKIYCWKPCPSLTTPL